MIPWPPDAREIRFFGEGRFYFYVSMKDNLKYYASRNVFAGYICSKGNLHTTPEHTAKLEVDR